MNYNRNCKPNDEFLQEIINHDILESLSEYEKGHIKREIIDRPLELYVRRIEKTGLNGLPVVLDAACGIGQWSKAFKLLGSRVIGVDLNIDRLRVANNLKTAHSSEDTPSKLLFIKGQISQLPIASNSIDLVFCYGSIMFTKVENTIMEFSRILKPNGILYINYSSWGWYIKRMFKRSLFLQSIVILGRTLASKNSNIVLSHAKLKNILENNGFTVKSFGGEGLNTLEGAHTPLPDEVFYPAKVLGLAGVKEIFSLKSEVAK